MKEQVFKEIEPHLAPDAILGSNTSTLPITGLAENVSRPDDFIGLHFFSPVDKMPLLEIIKGEKTGDEVLYKSLDFAKQIGKTPIVVNDSRGFFTSRVIGTFINEGIGMLAEGIPAPSIEQASSQAGYPAPVLQLSDELNMKLMKKIRVAAENSGEVASGWSDHPSIAVIDTMLENDRPGKLEKVGFYDYDENAKRTGLWSGLKENWGGDNADVPFEDLKERMMFIESIETVKCMDEGVIETVADANIGSIMGIGFPAWTGGVVQYMNGYEGGLAGLRRPRPRARREVRRALHAARVPGRQGRGRREVRGQGADRRLANRSHPSTAGRPGRKPGPFVVRGIGGGSPVRLTSNRPARRPAGTQRRSRRDHSPGRRGSTSSRRGRRPSRRAATTHSVCACRRRDASPSGMTRKCSLRAGRCSPHSGHR